MKDILKVTVMTVIGLMVSIVAYPFAHEFGHSIMSVFCGGEVISYTILPLPSVLCNVSTLSNGRIVIIGLSGILFPFLISVFVHPHKFYTWYLAIIFKGIVWLSLIISIFVIVFSNFGFTDTNDDMIKALSFWKNGEYSLITILIVLFVMMTISIKKDHPYKSICSEFGI